MNKRLWKPVGAGLFLLLSILLTGAGPLPQQGFPPEKGLSPRNQVYGDPEASMRIRNEVSPSEIPQTVFPGKQSAAILEPDALKYYAWVFSYITAQTGRSTITVHYEVNPISGQDDYQYMTVLFDGGTDSYSPRINPDGQRVIFTSYLAGNADLYTIYLDKSGLQRLTSNPAFDGWPVWSRDGNRVAFVSKRDGNYEIYVMQADGTSQIRLTNFAGSDYSPAWSPDGKQIAWIRQVDAANGQIWLMNSDGGNPHPISGSYRYLLDLVWSPYGSEMGFDYDANLDGYNEPFIASGTGITAVYFQKMSGADYQDVYFSAWGHRPNWVVTNRVGYIRMNGKFYYSGNGADLFDINNVMSSYGKNEFGNSYLQLPFEPDVLLLDRYAPHVEMDPLPEYSRASSFPVRWRAADSGIAGLYRVGLSCLIDPGNCPFSLGNFNQFPDGSVLNHLRGTPGESLSFGLQAFDWAENVSPLMTGYQTTLYRTRAQVEVRDARGQLQFGQHLDASGALNQQPGIQPVQDKSGRFNAYYPSTAATTLTLSGPLVKNPLSTQTDMLTDRLVVFGLPPDGNLAANGDFEATPALQGWVPGGDEVQISSVVHGGTQAARLGLPCVNPYCLADPVGVDLDLIAAQATDSKGNLHVVTVFGLYVVHNVQTGVWSIPQSIFPYTGINIGPMLIDKQDTIHLITGGGYYRKTANGSWTGPEALPTDDYYSSKLLVSAIAADPAGNVYALGWASHNYLLKRDAATGSWTKTAITTEADGLYKTNRVAGSTTGTLYIAGSAFGTWACQITIIPPNGSPLFEPCPFFVNADTVPPTLSVDDEDNLHLYSSGMYAVRKHSGEWSAPIYLFDNGYPGEVDQILPGAKGEIWAFSTIYTGFDQPVFFYKPSGSSVFVEGVSDPAVSPVFYLNPILFADRTGRLSFLIQNVNSMCSQGISYCFFAPGTASSPTTSTLEQTLTLPADLHAPTLSFFYRLDGSFAAAPDAFKAEIIPEGGSPVTVFQTGEPEWSWKQAFSDLSPWAGQTVTVRFTLTKTTGGPLLSASLDDVSVGAWTTPVVESVEPAVMLQPLPASQVVTLHGQNFIGDAATPPVVKLAGQPVQVTWIDTATLQFTVSGALAPGSYSIEVINPSGYTAFLPDGLVVKPRLVFIPRVHNQTR